jgi:hypothetical protein
MSIDSETRQSVALEHFIRLARRGDHRGASGGEKRAYRLAMVLLDELPGLDTRALQGMVLFAREVVTRPQASRDLIEE